MCFGVTFTVVFILLWPHLEDYRETLLAKISMMASVSGVFVGTYISLWLINQNRTRKIAESYFYRSQIIPIIFSTLQRVNEINEKINQKTNAYDKNHWRVLFTLYEDLITLINSNTSIPVDIRTGVNNLLISIYTPITISLDDSNPIRLNLSKYEDEVFAKKFFSTYTDEWIRKDLEKLKNEWSALYIAPPQD